MEKIDVAGLKISAQNKRELLQTLHARLNSGQKTFISTPYSEFLFRLLRDNSLQEFLNRADFAVPDGIGIFWAKKFLDLPLTAKRYWPKIFQAHWHMSQIMLAMIFNPRKIKSVFPEKIPGSDLVWDLAKLSAENNWSVFLLGGFGNTPKLAAAALKSKFPELRIAGLSNKNPGDPGVLDDIRQANPDFIFVAFGPIRQEKWIAENMDKLPARLFVGLGGTFDYLAGKTIAPPKLVRAAGLEWLYRLFTQPKRIKRIWQATFGLMNKLIHYKVFISLPLRPNAVSVILNQADEIFVGRKPGTGVDIIANQSPLKWKNYWQLPQGGVEPGENIIAACQREAEEETGMRNLKYLATSGHTHTYIWNNALRGFWHNRDYQFRGQTQRILYFRFDGNPRQIALPANEEFVEYKWVPAGELLHTVHEERQTVAKFVEDDINHGLIKLSKNAII